MPRKGQNPMRWVSDVYQPRNITVTTVVYIPTLQGYWAESLDVLKLCLQSLRKSTQIPFDLMVFDNGSCTQVQEYLLEMRSRGIIQYLLLSEHNLGKVGAWNFLFSAAPGQIISFTDSDVYFLPGWLEASLEILETFPEAGMITAQPIAGGDLSQLWTAKIARSDDTVSIKTGHLIPEHYLSAHLKGLGAGREVYAQRQKNRKDVLLSRDSTQAYATASHFQFTTTRNVLTNLFPAKTIIPLGDDTQFEDDVLGEKLGFWRLSTTAYLVHHMGNVLPDFQNELPWLDITSPNVKSDKSRVSSPSKVKNKLLGRTIVRRILKQMNLLSYKLLYEQE